MTGDNDRPPEIPTLEELETILQASPAAQAAVAAFMRDKSPEEQAKFRKDVLFELWEIGAM